MAKSLTRSTDRVKLAPKTAETADLRVSAESAETATADRATADRRVTADRAIAEAAADLRSRSIRAVTV